MWRVRFFKQDWLAAWLSRKFQPRGNWTASCPILSCSALAGITLQLLACLAHVQPWVTRKIQLRITVFLAHCWAFLHTISLTTHTRISPKYRITNCWNTSKFSTRIKPTKWLIKFNLTYSKEETLLKHSTLNCKENAQD